MSDSESLDLSAEDLMPAWVSGLENPAPPSPSAKYERDDSADRSKGNERGKHNRNRNDRGGGFRNDDRRQQGGGGRGKSDHRDRNRGSHDGRRENRQPVRAEDIVPQVDFVVEPTVEAVKALTKHIRATNRAYAMAEVAQMVLASSDRYRVIFRAKAEDRKSTKEKTSQDKQAGAFRMLRCKADGSVWLSREEAVAHFLNTPKLLEQFYEVEVVETEAPKGNFSVIAVCGLSGTILGPPNHHEYQQNIASLHRERFGNMPLERFKSRIEMRRDEETIEQWKEQKSTSKHYRVRTAKPEVKISEETAAEITPETSGSNAPTEEAPDTETNNTDELAPATDGEIPTEVIPDEIVTISPDSPDSPKSETESESEAEKAEGETQTDSDTGVAEEASEEDQSAPSLETKPEAETAITSMAELTRHFREHFARQLFKEVGEARLPGAATKAELSPALNERMNAEINWQKRGFPLPMVRTLCRKFEHQGLKFFKRGEKALFVSASRPRALAKETVLTDRLVVMLNHIIEKPGTLAGDLIKHLLGETGPTAKEKTEAPAEPSKPELALLSDLRWLLAEGYLIEFPNSELLPGTAVSADKRKRKPSKRSKKKRPAKKKAATEIKADDTKSTTAPEPATPKASLPEKQAPEGDKSDPSITSSAT
ncbi:MAG: hypothetical protein GXP30_09385 [Verrucomicrobia bacterium]|nr:hypothetical protein [Verrucomicrobiota bacterium]